MSRTLIVALALAASTLAATGCGGSSKAGSTSASTSAVSGTTTGTTAATSAPAPAAAIPTVAVRIAAGRPLSRARWIAKGDAICAHFNSEIEALAVNKAAELPRVLPQEAAYVRAEVVRLARLIPPAAQTSDWQQFLDESSRWAEGSAKLAEYGKLGDTITKSPIATATIAIHARVMKIARHDGFKECSKT